MTAVDQDLLLSECDFKAVRSSGAGGQHVNKTSSKVMLSWDLEGSRALGENQKSRLREKLVSRLTKGGVLILSYDRSRSQHKNKEQVIKNFLSILKKGIRPPKIRKKTKLTKASKLKRLNSKKQNAEKKANRKSPPF